VTGHEHSAVIFAVLQWIARRDRRPHVVIYTNWNLPKSGIRRWLKWFRHRLLSYSISRFVVYSNKQLAEYVRYFRLPAEKFTCVRYHMTINPAAFSVLDGAYVFSGGDYTRDYRSLIEAAQMLPYRFIIAARFRSYFCDLRIPDNVEILTASREEFFRLMAGARVVVVPLRPGLLHSGGQQTYLNAMAMGKAVVVADDGGADEYITNGQSGILVPPGNPGALRDAIQAVFEDRNLAGRLAQSAKTAAAAHSADAFCRRVVELVETCVRELRTKGQVQGNAGIEMRLPRRGDCPERGS
jgi:glycosyltransferase involved in cell wall biosynthesis